MNQGTKSSSLAITTSASLLSGVPLRVVTEIFEWPGIVLFSIGCAGYMTLGTYGSRRHPPYNRRI
jgi:hypothetical protein